MTGITQHPTTPESVVTPDTDAERQADQFVRDYYRRVAAMEEKERLHRKEMEAIAQRQVDFANRLERATPIVILGILCLVLAMGNLMCSHNAELRAQYEEGRGTQ